MRTFAKSVAIITAFAVTTRVIGFVFRIFLSRVLGAEMLGIYQIAMSFFMIFLTIVASGLPLTISKEVAKAVERKNNADVGAIATAGLVISLLTSSALCALVLLFRNFLGAIFTDERCINILIALMPAVIASSIYVALRAVWWGQKKFFLLGITELFEQIIRVLFFIVLLGVSFMALDTAGLAAISFTIACITSAALVVAVYLKSSKTKKSKNKYYKTIIKSASPITGVRVIASIAMPLISIIIPLRLTAAGWTTSQAIAQYGIIVGMTLPILTIPGTLISSLATALVPELSGSAEKKDTKSVSRQICGALKFTLFVTFLMLPAFIAFGEQIGIFVYDNALSGIYLTRCAWIMVPLALSQITNAILNSLGAETKAMKHYFLGSILMFTIIWFLPPVVGVEAVAIGMGTCMLVASALNIRMITKLTATHTNVTKLLSIFMGISVPALLLGKYTYGITKHLWPMMLSLPAAGTASVAVVLLLSQTFDLVDFGSFKLNKKSARSRT